VERVVTDYDPKVFWENRLSRDFTLYGVGFRGIGRPYNEWLYRVRSRVFRRLAKKIRPSLPAARVLDIGSGTGFYVSEWKRAGVGSIVASDITDVSVERLRDAFPGLRVENLDIGDPMKVFEPGSFDVISAFDVLFHILDDDRYRQALENVATLLRPGGYFLYSDNFLRAGEHRAVHQVSRLRSDIEAALKRNGLQIIERRPMFVLMNAPVDTQSRRLKAFWTRLEAQLKKGERQSRLIGAALYPVDSLLTKVMKEGPTTEVVLCRKSVLP
jgi:SAM-dependent methyltransferase